MIYIIKRNINIFGKNNTIKFNYDVKINESKNGFIDFDITNEEINIDKLLLTLTEESLRELNKVCPVYISLSKYIFDNNKNISVIEYETNKFSSKISRDDFINTQIKSYIKITIVRNCYSNFSLYS